MKTQFPFFKTRRIKLVLISSLMLLMTALGNNIQKTVETGWEFYITLIVLFLLCWLNVIDIISESIKNFKSQKAGENIIGIMLIAIAMLLFIMPFYFYNGIKKSNHMIEKLQHQSDSLRRIGK